MQLSDATTDGDSFSWSNLGSGLLDLAKTAAVAAGQYQVARLTTQAQASAQAQAQTQAQARAASLPLALNSPLPTANAAYQYQYPQTGSSIYSQSPAPQSNIVPVLLIAGVGLIAAFMLMGRK